MTLRESTTTEIEISGRTTTVDVVEPDPLTMLQFGAEMQSFPDGDAMTLEESHNALVIMADAYTDLPRGLIEQLPAGTLMGIHDDIEVVMRKQIRNRARRQQRMNEKMENENKGSVRAAREAVEEALDGE